MDSLQRKKHPKHRQTNNHYQRTQYSQYKNRLRNQQNFQNNTNKHKFDWLLCLIFCLGFIVAMLIAVVIYALYQHHDHTVQKIGKKPDPDENLGVSIIDYSREITPSKITPSDIPNTLPPLQSTQIEHNAIYQSLRDEIDVMKSPINCSFIDELYQCEGMYFNNFTHYNDDWSQLVGTKWHIPSKISTTFSGKKKQFKKWTYNTINYPIVPLYLTSKKPRDNIRISIVTQTSIDRLNLLELVAQNWNGVISVGIYIRLEESLLHSQQLIIELFERIESQYEAVLDISLLFETDYLYKRSENSGLYSVMYPVNHLRNLALQTAKTELVLLTDGDFIPNTNFHDKASKQYDIAVHNAKNRSTNRSMNIALIIPAFEFGSSYAHYTLKQIRRRKKSIMDKEEHTQKVINDINQLPLTKKEIIKLYSKDLVRGFHIHRCKACHTPTNYSRWLNASRPYVVRYKASYEPYIMTKRIGLHRYDARFRGYGWNKIVHLLTIAWIDKSYWTVANDLFIFHIPHRSSRDAATYFKGTHTMRWKWIMGLAKLALRDLKRKKDQTGYIIS